MKTFYQWLEVTQPKFYTRWMTRLDYPKLVELIQGHPDSSETADLPAAIKQILNQRNVIGMVSYSTDNEAVLHGACLYFLEKNQLEMPFIIADSKESYQVMIKHIASKLSSARRPYLYIRAHYDPNLLAAIKAEGLKTKAQGDWIVATAEANFDPSYPKLDVPAITPDWQHYNNLLSGNVMKHKDEPGHYLPRPEPENKNDPWGLFKNKPWKDKHSDDEEFV